MANLILSAFADEYSGSLDEQISALKKHGINYMEFRSVGGSFIPDIPESEALKIKETLKNAGLKVSSLGSPLGKTIISDNMRDYEKVAEHIFNVADIFETKYVRCFSFYLPKGATFDEYKTRIFDEMETLVLMAEKHGITLCHENEANIFGESPENCLELLDYFGGKLKCVFDMGNFVLDGYESYPYAYNLLKKHIAYFHIKDALAVGAVVPPGKGEAKIKEILGDYIKNGKNDTFVTLEPHLQTFSGLNALVGKTFDNPYKYQDSKAAFDDAAQKIKEILNI